MKNYDYSVIFDGFTGVTLNGKWGFIDERGSEICEIKYDDVLNFKNGYAGVGIGGKYGFINQQGKEICDIKYESVWDFQNGFAPVKLNDKLGFIDMQGKEICPIKYDDVTDFFETGYAEVLLGEEEFYIDENGVEYDCKYIRRK